MALLADELEMPYSLFDSYDVSLNRKNLIIGDLFEPLPLEVQDEDDQIETEEEDPELAEFFAGFFLEEDEQTAEADMEPSFGLKPRVPLFKPRVVKKIEMDAVADISERYLISTFFGDGIRWFDPPLSCPICMDDFHFEDDPFVYLKNCGHFICHTCLVS